MVQLDSYTMEIKHSLCGIDTRLLTKRKSVDNLMVSPSKVKREVRDTYGERSSESDEGRSLKHEH